MSPFARAKPKEPSFRFKYLYFDESHVDIKCKYYCAAGPEEAEEPKLDPRRASESQFSVPRLSPRALHLTEGNTWRNRMRRCIGSRSGHNGFRGRERRRGEGSPYCERTSSRTSSPFTVMHVHLKSGEGGSREVVMRSRIPGGRTMPITKIGSTDV